MPTCPIFAGPVTYSDCPPLECRLISFPVSIPVFITIRFLFNAHHHVIQILGGEGRNTRKKESSLFFHIWNIEL